PIDSTRLQLGGSWSVYWYNGNIVSSEIIRGLDVLELTPSQYISQNEIDAAKTVKADYLNAQGQPKFAWPASFSLARAYVGQGKLGRKWRNVGMLLVGMKGKGRLLCGALSRCCTRENFTRFYDAVGYISLALRDRDRLVQAWLRHARKRFDCASPTGPFQIRQ